MLNLTSVFLFLMATQVIENRTKKIIDNDTLNFYYSNWLMDASDEMGDASKEM